MSAHTLSLLSISPISSSQSLPRRLNARSSMTSSFHKSGSLVSTVARPHPSLASQPILSKRLSTIATVLMSLSNAKPIEGSADNTPKWSARLIKSFVLAELEARKLKYPDTGTESLLMGILAEGTSAASKFLRSHGITFFKVQQEIVDLLGKSESGYFSPLHPPLTEPAQKAFDEAVELKLKSGGNGELTTTHLLLGIWAQEVSAARKILEKLGFDDQKAEELANSIDKETIYSIKRRFENLRFNSTYGE